MGVAGIGALFIAVSGSAHVSQPPTGLQLEIHGDTLNLERSDTKSERCSDRDRCEADNPD